MRHMISVWIANKPGELARVAGMFSARGFNIDSLCVAETGNPECSCLTLATEGNPRRVEQLVHQLEKLVRVEKVSYVTHSPYLERELALIQLTPHSEGAREAGLALTQTPVTRLVASDLSSIVIEAVGTPEELSNLIARLQPLGACEVARSGALVLVLGNQGSVASDE